MRSARRRVIALLARRRTGYVGRSSPDSNQALENLEQISSALTK